MGDRSDQWNYPGYCLQDVGPVPEVTTSLLSDSITFSLVLATQQGSIFNCCFAIPFLKAEVLGAFLFSLASRHNNYTVVGVAMVLVVLLFCSCGQPFWASFNHDHQMAPQVSFNDTHWAVKTHSPAASQKPSQTSKSTTNCIKHTTHLKFCT